MSNNDLVKEFIHDKTGYPMESIIITAYGEICIDYTINDNGNSSKKGRIYL